MRYVIKNAAGEVVKQIVVQREADLEANIPEGFTAEPAQLPTSESPRED